jgi:hypothetical protein
MTTPTSNMGKRRWTLSLCIGGSLGLAPVLAGIILFSTSPGTVLSRFAYFFFVLGLPDLLLEALVMREPHGGGTPLEMLFLVMPFNMILYTFVLRRNDSDRQTHWGKAMNAGSEPGTGGRVNTRARIQQFRRRL